MYMFTLQPGLTILSAHSATYTPLSLKLAFAATFYSTHFSAGLYVEYVDLVLLLSRNI